MKKTRISLLSTLLFFVMFSALLAQPPGGGRGFQMSEEDIKERTAETAETLGLNEDQHKKFLAVEMDFYNKMQIARQKMRNADPRPTREEMRATMTTFRDEHDKKVKEIFTDEQFTQYMKLREQRRSEMEQQRRENQGSGQSQRGRGRN